MKSRPLLERLVEKIHINEVTECWEWTASLQAQGYAQISIKLEDGRHQPQLAHILTYEWLVGPVPEGMELDHLCRRRYCVNPFHLEAVTHPINVIRGEAPTAIASRTHTCKRGHPLQGENVYIGVKGERQCIICRKGSSKKFHTDNPDYNKIYHALRKRVGHPKRNNHD